jgi:hypothetical protein
MVPECVFAAHHDAVVATKLPTCCLQFTHKLVKLRPVLENESPWFQVGGMLVPLPIGPSARGLWTRHAESASLWRPRTVLTTCPVP